MDQQESNNLYISFEKQIKDYELIIIPVKQINEETREQKTFNFLIDSGASVSMIDKKELQKMQYAPIKGSTTAYGIDGQVHDTDAVITCFKLGDYYKCQRFQVFDISSAFQRVERELNIHLSGIFGTDFLIANKIILDYEKLKLYYNSKDDLSGDSPEDTV